MPTDNYGEQEYSDGETPLSQEGTRVGPAEHQNMWAQKLMADPSIKQLLTSGGNPKAVNALAHSLGLPPSWEFKDGRIIDHSNRASNILTGLTGAALGISGGAMIGGMLAGGAAAPAATAAPAAASSAGFAGIPTTVGLASGAGIPGATTSLGAAGTIGAGSGSSLMSTLMKGKGILQAGSKMLASGADTAAHNRGSAIDAMLANDRNQLGFAENQRASESDIMRKMAQTAYIKGGGFQAPTTGYASTLPHYGFGPKPTTPEEQAAATTLQGQLQNRLANPLKPTDISGKVNPGTGEKIMSWAGPALGLIGNFIK